MLFFIVNVFFLKQVISALMISGNLNCFSSIHCLLAFSTNPFITNQRLKRRKTYERLVLSFYIVSFVLNVIVSVCNGLKQTKPNRLFQIPFFHRNLIYVYLKINILRRMWRDLGMSLQLYQSHSFASLILIHKLSLILPRTHSSSHEEKRS